MKTKFAMGGSSVQIFKLNQETVLNKLPAQIYSVAFHPMMGYSLNIVKKTLETPNKIYGKAIQRADKCINTYQNRSASTGILMTGDKGTGKTLQMAVLANKVLSDLDLPIIMITEPHSGAQFTKFIEDIGECCLIFDEFGKMYKATARGNIEADADAPQQSTLLSLMDGVDKTKRMIILTENSEYDVSDFMLNRPSRIFYHFKYKKLEEESILGYCKDKKVDKNITDDILELSRKSKLFSFDMLQSIVEEYLRFGSPIKEIITDLNIDISEADIDRKQVLKIINKETNEELPIYGTDIVEGIDEYGASVFYKYKSKNEKDKRESKEIYIEGHQLVYKKQDQSIYETSHFTILTKDLTTKQQNYSMVL